MINLFKQKPLVVDLITDRKDIYENAKPVKAAKVFPEWWKALPNTLAGDPLTPASSMKRCVGFTELYNSGFIIPMWSDLNVQISPIGTTDARWCFSDERSRVADHPAEQRGAYLPKTEYQHVKLECPWRAVCDEDVKWAFIGPTWNYDKPEEIVFPPAVVDFKYQHSLHVNLFLPRTSEAKMFNFVQGQPVAHLLPMTERPVEYRYRLVSTDELNGFKTLQLWFTNKYVKYKTNKGKCPF